MSNTVFIKELNNTPVIFNVDNMTDEAALEALQAIKMPESMASSIFGNQANFADNKTCIITSNPENPAFPFNVVFDSTKIPAKPKRDTGILAGLAMPSYNFIDIPLSETVPIPNNPTYHMYEGKAVADGYIYVCLFYSNNGKYYDANITVIDDNKEILYRVSVGHVFQYYSDIIPIKKGMDFSVFFPAEGLSTFTLRFIYAQGELPE